MIRNLHNLNISDIMTIKNRIKQALHVITTAIIVHFSTHYRAAQAQQRLCARTKYALYALSFDLILFVKLKHTALKTVVLFFLFLFWDIV